MDEHGDTSGTSLVRISDGERDTAAATLGNALAEGRLDPVEHEQRLDAVYNAKTRGELTPILSDLPETSPVENSAGAPRPVHGAERVVEDEPTSQSALTILSATERVGRWVVPPTFSSGSVLGAVTIDLREARFTAKHTTVRAHSILGSVEVIAPDDIIVRVEGAGIMGGYWLDGAPSESVPAGAPVVTVKGISLLGSVWGVVKQREHQKPKRRRW